MTKHISVLPQETLAAMQPQDNQVLVDATLGGGGHSWQMLQSAKQLKLICLDLEAEALTNFRARLIAEGYQEQSDSLIQPQSQNQVWLANQNFGQLHSILQNLNIAQVNAVLADLGWSTDQLQRIPGLSYQQTEAALDMRFNSTLGVTAADLLNSLSAKELTWLWRNYSDISENQIKKLALRIIEMRALQKFARVGQLVEVVTALTFDQRSLAQVFQGLRIAVNNEFNNLNDLLNQSWQLLTTGGSLVIITFHSGEEKVIQAFGRQHQLRLPQPIRPSVNELRSNISARSAKLWHIIKK